MIEIVIQARLEAQIGDLVGDRIYPTLPTENTSLPFVIHTVTDTESHWRLSGPCGLTTYQIGIDVLGVQHQDAQDLASSVIEALDGWQSEDVITCLLISAYESQLQEGYSFILEFTVVATV